MESSVTPKSDREFDVVIIGSGPGGEGAAMHLAKNGRNVAVVERMARVGGTCTHVGTIPSKSLRHAIFRVAESNKNPLLRETDLTIQLTFPQLRKTANSVIERQVEMRRTYYERTMTSRW